MVDNSFVPDTAEEAEGETFNRTDTRDSLFLMAVLRRPGQSDEIKIKVRNLSAGGLMAEAPVPFCRAEPVQVELKGVGQVDGAIAWTAGGRIGIAFAQPIDPRLARRPIATPVAPPSTRTARPPWRPGFA